MAPERPFATLHRLADRLGLPPTFVRDEAAAGRLPCIRRGRQLLFHVDTVQRMLLERAREQAPAASSAHVERTQQQASARRAEVSA